MGCLPASLCVPLPEGAARAMFVMLLHIGSPISIKQPSISGEGFAYLPKHTNLVLSLGRLSAACRVSRQEHQESLAGP